MRISEETIAAAGAELKGDLSVPEGAKGAVLFAHGSGSSRFSPRNRYAAGVLQRAGFATLLLDLLTLEEAEADEESRAYRFDIRLLADRVEEALRWLKESPPTRGLPIGLYGASTGAAAALVAAAELPSEVGAVVSRGGRPDLAGDLLAEVKAPTLLIVGGEDEEVLRLNREASARMKADRRLEIVPGATHLFEEPGTLERACRLAASWYKERLAGAKRKGRVLR